MTRELDIDDLQELQWGFAGARVLTVAARTGLLRRLAEGPAAIAGLAAELGLDPLATGKLVRALAALGVARPAGDGYRLVDALAPHFRAGEDDLAPALAHAHDLYDGWGDNLERWLRSEGWGTRPRDLEGIRRFASAMRAHGRLYARRAAAHLDLAGVRRMLDVGGGFGQYAATFAELHEGLEAVVLDTPEVAAIAPAEHAGTAVEGRIRWRGGDYLEADYGTGYDLVLLANVLHQETAARVALMVSRAAAAAAPGGRVAVVDFRIDPDRHESPFGALFAINMRSFGDTHTEPEIRAWMEGASLRGIRRIDLDRFRWLIVGTQPG